MLKSRRTSIILCHTIIWNKIRNLIQVRCYENTNLIIGQNALLLTILKSLTTWSPKHSTNEPEVTGSLRQECDEEHSKTQQSLQRCHNSKKQYTVLIYSKQYCSFTTSITSWKISCFSTHCSLPQILLMSSTIISPRVTDHNHKWAQNIKN